MRYATWLAASAGVLVGFLLHAALLTGPHLGAAPVETSDSHLPRFTEEREAAALFFVKKHLPELLPMLEQLKKGNAAQYEREVREIYHVTEMLAELRDEPRRYELELKIWKTENLAHTFVARLSTPSADERKQLETKLQELAKELVELDVQVLETRADQLDRELGEVKDELSRMREAMERQVKDRYEGLLDKAKKPKK